MKTVHYFLLTKVSILLKVKMNLSHSTNLENQTSIQAENLIDWFLAGGGQSIKFSIICEDLSSCKFEFENLKVEVKFTN